MLQNLILLIFVFAFLKWDFTMAKTEKSEGKGLRSLLAGMGAGVATACICCPLDVAKVRMQVQGSLGITKYSGSLSAINVIFKEEGLKGLFKGLGPALMTVPIFWGIYFYSYDFMKERSHNYFSSPVASHILSAVSAGAIGDVITNPMWVIRTRVQTLVLHHAISSKKHSMTTLDMARTIYQEEGFFAFYKGLGASFLGLSHIAVQFPLYEHLKMLARNRREGGEESALDLMAASIIAKFCASVLTYPHEVLRSRIQYSRNVDVTLRSAFLDIVKNEGVASLWTGLRVNLVRVIPSTLSTFLAYEYISRYLQTNFPSR